MPTCIHLRLSLSLSLSHTHTHTHTHTLTPTHSPTHNFFFSSSLLFLLLLLFLLTMFLACDSFREKLSVFTIPLLCLAVSSTCGYEFFLPPLQRFDSSSIVGWIEVVACRDVNQPAVPVTVTLCTTSNDKVHTFSLNSNETARVELASLNRKDASIAKYGKIV